MSVVSKAAPTPAKTPSKRTRKPKHEPAPVTPGGSDETAYEEEEERANETQEVEDVAAAGLHEEDVAEQKDLIENLKRQRAAAMKSEDMEVDGTKNKRSRAGEEDSKKLNFDFKEPEVVERAIATNRRILGYLEEPRRRSFAWGLAAFVFGAGAVTLLPNFL